VNKIWLRLRYSTAARTGAASYIAFASTSIWGLATIPLAVSFLDKEELGLWTVINAFLSYLAWMDLGVGGATGRLMAKAVASRDQTEINCWWTTTRAVLSAQGLILVCAGMLLIPVFISLLAIPGHLASEAWMLMAGGILLTALSLPLRGVAGLLTAQNRFYWVPVIQIFLPWCNFLVFFILLKSGWGLKSYIIAMGSTHVLNWISYNILVKTGPDRPHFDRAGLQWPRLKRLFGFSANITVMGLVETLMRSMPAMLITRLGGLPMVPIYNFSWKGASLGGNLMSRTYQSFYPSMQRMYVTGNSNAFQIKHEQVGFLTLGMSMLMASAVIVGNPVVVQLLAGGDFYIGSTANAWFAISMITLPMTGLFRCLLPISGNYGKNALVSVLKLIIACVFSIGMWRWFGMTGVAASFAIAPIVTGTYCYYRGNKNCGFKPHQLSSNVAAAALAAALLTGVVGMLPTALDSSTDSICNLFIFTTIVTLPTWHELLLGAIPGSVGLWILIKSAKSFIANN
jgi:O-antigen/teichoic acid export membrane protein